MCALFKNRYVIGSKRYRGYDYSSPGGYFITICTKNRLPYFGTVKNGQIVLSELGNYLHNEWLKTPFCRPDMNISLDQFVIMPDHFHAIIIIGKNRYNGIIKTNTVCRNAMHGVSTYENAFAPQCKNLPSIIRGFKSVVTTYARKMNMDFA